MKQVMKGLKFLWTIAGNTNTARRRNLFILLLVILAFVTYWLKSGVICELLGMIFSFIRG